MVVVDPCCGDRWFTWPLERVVELSPHHYGAVFRAVEADEAS